jgi:hypothetical protein
MKCLAYEMKYILIIGQTQATKPREIPSRIYK